jgi:spore coat protein U-like protein
MKKLLVVLMVIFVVAMTGEAMADTTTVTVSATVVGTCQFFNGGGSMNFGSMDPSVGGNITATVTQPTFWCTKNATYNITDDGGLNNDGTTRRLKGAVQSDLIPYTFSYNANGSGLGHSTPITMNITGQIADGDYQDASADTYSDTVTLTITP